MIKIMKHYETLAYVCKTFVLVFEPILIITKQNKVNGTYIN